MRRGLAIWVGLMLAYSATLGLPAHRGSDYTAAEAHRLLVAESIVDDHDLAVGDGYRDAVWRDWYRAADGDPLRPAGQFVGGRLLEPAGLGFPLAISPAYAIGGPTGVELFCAALLALAFACGAGVARRLVPEPWATRSAVVCGLSPPALAASTTIAPEAFVAALVTGAAVLALRVRESPRLRPAAGASAMLGLVAWMSLRAVPVAVVIGASLWRWLRRRGRGFTGFVALEIAFTLLVVYITFNDRLFGGFTPLAARLDGGSVTGASGVLEHLERITRVPGLLLDPTSGLLLWAPMLALVPWALWLLWQANRERLAVAVPEHVDVEVTAGLCALVGAAALGVAVFAEPALPGNALVAPGVVVAFPLAAPLVAWGWRRAPRTGNALAGLTVLLGAYVLVGARVADGFGMAPLQGLWPW